jgi:hypothetical protein
VRSQWPSSGVRARASIFRIGKRPKPTPGSGAFKAATRARAGALLVLPRVLEWHARRITELAAKSRLPAMYAQRHYVETGGLMFYGANGIELYRRAAVFVEAPSPPTCRSSSQRSSNW